MKIPLKMYKTFFNSNNEMPSYYTNAFTKKIKELVIKYKLPNNILDRFL